MKLYADRLTSHLQNNLAPCYLVSGDEHLLVEEALDEIRAAAREQGFTSRESQVAMSNFNWSELAAIGSNLSLFAERRVIELRLPTGKPGRDGSAAICEFVERLEYDTVYHEHLSYFSVTSLMRVCEEAGLSIVRLERMPVHGGTLRMYAAHREHTAEHAPEVQEDGSLLLFENGLVSGKVQEPVLGREAKRVTLDRLCRDRNLDRSDVLAVGDGANDIEMLQAAGLGVALHAGPAVRDAANACIDRADLTALLYLQGYRKSEFVTVDTAKHDP